MTDAAVLGALSAALAARSPPPGSAARVGRLPVLSRPADLDHGEITDKGYVNQRQVLPNGPRWSTSCTPARLRPGVIVVAG